MLFCNQVFRGIYSQDYTYTAWLALPSANKQLLISLHSLRRNPNWDNLPQQEKLPQMIDAIMKDRWSLIQDHEFTESELVRNKQALISLNKLRNDQNWNNLTLEEKVSQVIDIYADSKLSIPKQRLISLLYLPHDPNWDKLSLAQKMLRVIEEIKLQKTGDSKKANASDELTNLDSELIKLANLIELDIKLDWIIKQDNFLAEKAAEKKADTKPDYRRSKL